MVSGRGRRALGRDNAVLFLLFLWWMRWKWSGTSSLQVLGCALLVSSVAAGTWAVAKMGWARLLLVGALFPGGRGR
ncbi:MAG: hypothetical protein H0U02_07870 [Rubrobacter sp.]|nr:hypothetical protein [Rubrobacter sp.]